ncbi:DUF4132 domain-containing protein [Spirillospora sp. NPDC029432]|uniref:DUF4132 domain-containing protein n=1 Tax=Spirillospora sp. NPDC029432 TaxID=3154599 RepID=UPI00345215CC
MTDVLPLGEDILHIPDDWHAQLEPRRGGLAVSPPEVDAKAVEEVRALLVDRRDHIDAMLGSGHCDPGLAGAVRDFLAGRDTVTGAAAVAVITRLGGRADHYHRVAHAWTAEHDPAWPAAAFVASGEIICKPRVWGPAAKGIPLAERYELRYATAADGLAEWSTWSAAGPLLRRWLAAADEETHRFAERRLGALRTGTRSRLAAAYLLPDRTDWVDESCRDLGTGQHHSEVRHMLLASLGTVEQAGRVSFDNLGSRRDVSLLATLLDGVGPGIAPILARALDEDPHGRRGRDYTGARHELLEALARIPTDEALTLLLDRLEEAHVRPAVRAALERFPVRGLRVLAARAQGGSRRAVQAAELLGAFAAADPGRTRSALARLTEETRNAVEAIAGGSVAEATEEMLPRILVAPPWAEAPRGKKAAKPFVLADPPAPPAPEMHWTGEDLARIEEFQSKYRPLYPKSVPVDWKRAVQDVDPDASYRGPDGMMWGGHLLMASLLIEGPVEVAGALLARWADSGDAGHPVLYQPLIVHRYGLAALPHLLRRHEKVRAEGRELLLPFLSADVARLMAFWLAHRATCRPIAEEWFARYGIRAAALLLPDALGKRGRRRADAEHALAHLAVGVGSGKIVNAARELGGDAAGAIAGLLAEIAARSPEMPEAGAWADPADLPRVLLSNRAHVLPPGAVRHLITMLAASSLEEPHPGLPEVRQACDAASLAEFSMAVFGQWLQHGAPGKDLWALTQLTAFDGETATRRLAPIVARWPRTGAPRWASTALGVLATIGTDRALLILDGVTRQSRYPSLRDQAGRTIRDAARRKGLSTAQLADRLVPDLGLDASGTLTLDYGRRSFTVGFDERLRAVVTGPDGERRATLPRPGARDDAELAPAAYRRFSELRQDVQAIAAEQLRRLETAMLSRRSWSLADFRTLLVEHPLMGHLARRLLWLSREGGGSHTLFRIAEDRTFADLKDETVAFPGHATVFIPHPVELPKPVVEAWAEVFADYECLQPFPQLGREVHRLDDQEHATGRLPRFEGLRVPTGTILGLTRRDWRRGTPQDGGMVHAFSRPLSSCDLVIELDPGIAAGTVQTFPEQTLRRVYLDDGTGEPADDPIDNQTFDAADPVLVSEALTDLIALAR